MSRRRGFTLIELVMVVGIIAILIALLLPAVQSTRESARRVLCENNLRQLGIALGNYASVHHVFPPGVVDSKGPIANWPGGYKVGWGVQILPFIEQANTYRHIDHRLGIHNDANATAIGQFIGVFNCPSDSRTGLMSYMGCHHDVEAPIDADNHGVLYLNSHVAYDDITDGPAYTLLLGEAIHTPSLGWASGTRATLRNAGHRLNDPDPVGPGQGPINVYPPKDLPGLNDPSTVPALVQGGALSLYYVGGFSSHHPYGANSLFCDGSARFLKESIDQCILQRLANRADGEVIGGDQF